MQLRKSKLFYIISALQNHYLAKASSSIKTVPTGPPCNKNDFRFRSLAGLDDKKLIPGTQNKCALGVYLSAHSDGESPPKTLKLSAPRIKGSFMRMERADGVKGCTK